MTTIRADVTEVQIGIFSIEGLMSENGDFGVAIPQLAELELVPPGRSSKQLEALLGIPFQSHVKKWKTSINPKEVNVIPLDLFQSVIRAMDKKGNEFASAFVDTMFGLSLHQVFADAFGIKFEAQERQQWLITRMSTKHDFRPLTDQLQAWGFTESKEYARFIWAFQTKLGIASGTRDELSIETLVLLQGKQVRLTTLMECGKDPWSALQAL